MKSTTMSLDMTFTSFVGVAQWLDLKWALFSQTKLLELFSERSCIAEDTQGVNDSNNFLLQCIRHLGIACR